MIAMCDRVWQALSDAVRSGAEVAQRAGVQPTSAAPALGQLRQHGRVESQRWLPHDVAMPPSDGLIGAAVGEAVAGEPMSLSTTHTGGRR